MPQVRQRGALSALTKPRLLEIANALDLGLPGRLLKSELVDAIAASPRAPFPRILKLLRYMCLRTMSGGGAFSEKPGFWVTSPTQMSSRQTACFHIAMARSSWCRSI